MGNKVITLSKAFDKPVREPDAKYLDLSMRSSRTTLHGEDGKVKQKNYIQNLKDVEAVRNAMVNIFTWIPGQRVLDPEFGNLIRGQLYEGITEFTSEQIIASIREAVLKYEPRVEIDDIVRYDGDEEHEHNEVDVAVVYHVKGFPERTYQLPVFFSEG